MRAIPAVLALSLISCAGAPVSSTPSSASAEANARKAEQANLRLAEEGQRQQAGASEALATQTQATVASAIAAGDAFAEAKAQAGREVCAQSRPERAADAQRYAAAQTAFIDRASSHMKDIRANCKLTLTETGAVRIEKRRGGFEINRVKQEGVHCKGGPPKGLSEYDVWLVLSPLQEGAIDWKSSPVASESEYSSENRTCRNPDERAGFDSEVRGNDAAGLVHLMRWKPPMTSAPSGATGDSTPPRP